MKRHWIEYTENWTPGPMTIWVHIPSDANPKVLNPHAPNLIPGKGYLVYYVEVEGFTFQFASLAEMRVCIDTIGKKLLPNILKLAHLYPTWVALHCRFLSYNRQKPPDHPA